MAENPYMGARRKALENVARQRADEERRAKEIRVDRTERERRFSSFKQPIRGRAERLLDLLSKHRSWLWADGFFLQVYEKWNEQPEATAETIGLVEIWVLSDCLGEIYGHSGEDYRTQTVIYVSKDTVEVSDEFFVERSEGSGRSLYYSGRSTKFESPQEATAHVLGFLGSRAVKAREDAQKLRNRHELSTALRSLKWIRKG